ncbi:exo-beta-N-acetylmuramidase NamZ family protein [Alistipes timonensis]|uniref:exo-beta-N-acetylmuramidase NamZ family protein n=1 Tax=Alistipes timonensis TaxID=1465754 RepID=UPI003F592D6E
MAVLLPSALSARVLVGMTDTAAYFPLLRGQRVAVLANQTSVAEMPGAAGADAAGRVHLVDLLHGEGFDVAAIFSPEHGFRGTADAGEHVKSSVDARTGIPIRSLYDGNTKRPSDEAMRSFDVLVVDMQDVGLRFYTYYISMLRMMDACADFGRRVVVLDRPNPNGHIIDGPVLDMKYRSGVGAIPVPVLHGLTMGEIARMAAGEGWAKKCALTVVKCRNYTHATEYLLPVAPSPNLPTARAVYLYAALCPFEGTVVSLGRGTDKPFEMYGHPDMTGRAFTFTPRPTAGAKHPPLEGRLCRGVDLSGMPLAEARDVGFSLKYVMDACADLGMRDKFFTPMFEKLVGVGWVREMILAGAPEEEIRARWAGDVERYRERRTKYLLYE